MPTYHEAANVGELADRLFASLPDDLADAELIFVDDNSGDGIDRAVADSPHAGRIHLCVRTNERGLASAVLHGLGHARGRYIVVMDADLSHPPEMVGELVAPLRDGTAEMTIGSRYVDGASTDETWSWYRRANSAFATLLARPFARVRDPMSGFFAMARDTLNGAAHCNPVGYKIGLELLVKCRVGRVKEVPIHFSDRVRGKSKMTVGQQVQYLEHLSRLYDFKYPRLVPVLKFLIVIGLGLLGGYAWTGLGYLLGGADAGAWWYYSAYWPAVAINGVAYWRYMQAMKGRVPIRRPRMEFEIISGLEWLTYAAVAWWWLGRRATMDHAPWLAGLLLAFGAGFVMRFLLRKLAGHDIRGLRTNGLKDGA